MFRYGLSRTLRLLVCTVAATGFAAAPAWSQAKPIEGQSQVVHKKPTAEIKALAVEWTTIMKEHPKFARVFLAQQFILMDSKDVKVTQGMCGLAATDLPVLFEGYWLSPCGQARVVQRPSGVIACLTVTNRDPGRCVSVNEDDQWFDDPTGRTTVPPRLPDSPSPRL